MSVQKESTISFQIGLDENHVPEKIQWNASDTQEGGDCKAALITLWDAEKDSTLKVDLWTKEMSMDDMKTLVHQSVMLLADTLERATGETENANAMREFGKDLGIHLGVVVE